MQWQWQQRNVQKSAMQVQSCCFANLKLLLFCRSRCLSFWWWWRWLPFTFASFTKTLRAFSYSCSSMVTVTSTCSPPASSLISSVTKKACRRAFSIPFWYQSHKVSRAAMFSTWTLRHTQPLVMDIRFVPAGSTQVLTAWMSSSYLHARVKTSRLAAIVKPPATTLNAVLTFRTKTNTKKYWYFPSCSRFHMVTGQEENKLTCTA